VRYTVFTPGIRPDIVYLQEEFGSDQLFMCPLDHFSVQHLVGDDATVKGVLPPVILVSRAIGSKNIFTMENQSLDLNLAICYFFNRPTLFLSNLHVIPLFFYILESNYVFLLCPKYLN
jgi:hypothetical protein